MGHRQQTENRALTNRTSGKWEEIRSIMIGHPAPSKATLLDKLVWNESLRKRGRGQDEERRSEDEKGAEFSNTGTNRTKPGCGQSRQMFWIKQTNDDGNQRNHSSCNQIHSLLRAPETEVSEPSSTSQFTSRAGFFGRYRPRLMAPLLVRNHGTAPTPLRRDGLRSH